jgi:glyoxylase-like metal-dependent hydrolase (beta-lactamase superfamily II)
MIIKQITVGPFQMNVYIIHQSGSNECLLIDPSDELERIYDYIDQNNLQPVAIVNTHAHIDHIRFTKNIQDKYELPFYLAQEELPLLENLVRQGAMYGIETAEPPQVTHTLTECDALSVGSFSFKVLHAPGHSPGSMCFLFDKDIIAGDVLFYDSIGRTDLYMGDYDLLIQSIQTKLLTLPDDTRVYPGHGPQTTIGRERQYNPFLQ